MTGPLRAVDPPAEGSGHDSNRLLTSPGQRFGARLGRRSASGALQERVVDQQLRSLREALDQVVADHSVEHAAALVVAARRRFVAGTGKSLGHAQLLSADLSAGLSHVLLLDGTTVRPLDVLAEVHATDVLVAYSLRRYRRETVELGRAFARAGGSLVAITDAADAPLAAWAEVTVAVPTDSASYADSPTPVAAVSHLLATLTTASAKGARRRLAERDRLSQELGLYTED